MNFNQKFGLSKYIDANNTNEYYQDVINEIRNISPLFNIKKYLEHALEKLSDHNYMINTTMYRLYSFMKEQKVKYYAVMIPGEHSCRHDQQVGEFGNIFIHLETDNQFDTDVFSIVKTMDILNYQSQ